MIFVCSSVFRYVGNIMPCYMSVNVPASRIQKHPFGDYSTG